MFELANSGDFKTMCFKICRVARSPATTSLCNFQATFVVSSQVCRRTSSTFLKKINSNIYRLIGLDTQLNWKYEQLRIKGFIQELHSQDAYSEAASIGEQVLPLFTVPIFLLKLLSIQQPKPLSDTMSWLPYLQSQECCIRGHYSARMTLQILLSFWFDV